MKRVPFLSQLRILKLIILLVSLFGTTTFSFDIKGGGASFPDPLFQRMIEEYYFEKGVSVNYLASGSANGFRSLKLNDIDFAASEIPESVLLSDGRNDFVFIPFTMGAVSLAYNLPGNPIIKLTPSVIQQIFSGKITVWDDPRIQALNLSVTLPNLSIQVLGRSQRSGTQFLMRAFLQRYGLRFQKWASRAIKFNSNKALCEAVSTTIGTIGITEWNYAKQYNLTVGAIQNRSGAFIIPNLNSIRAAALNDKNSSVLAEMGLLDSSISDAYPICGYSWVMTFRKLDKKKSFEEAQELVRWLSWITQHGQLLAEEMYYPALPYPLLKLIEKELTKITHSGIVLL